VDPGRVLALGACGFVTIFPRILASYVPKDVEPGLEVRE
jgi:hypothetical protein